MAAAAVAVAACSSENPPGASWCTRSWICWIVQLSDLHASANPVAVFEFDLCEFVPSISSIFQVFWETAAVSTTGSGSAAGRV